jgi:hypothetical protein
MMVSTKLRRILKLFRDIGVRLGATTGNDFTKEYPALAAAKKLFPNSAVLKELEGFPEFLAFKNDLKDKDPVFFVAVIDDSEQTEKRIKLLDEFASNSNVSQILVLQPEGNIETAETQELLNRVHGFWIKERIRKPLKDLVPTRRRIASRRPQRKKEA